MTAQLPENVEAVLPLSPAQSGILFHSLGAETVGSYVGVVTADLHGPIDLDRLRTAFAEVVMASDALRAAFVWEGVKRPLQVIQKRVDLPWDDVDWQGAAPDEVAARTDALTRHYRETGFDLTSAPLMHLTCARLGPTQTRLIWAVHHIVSDGWSTRCVLDAVLARYNGGPVAQGAQFADYLGWLKARDGSRDAGFWAGYLAGFAAPTRIESYGTSGEPGLHQRATRHLPPEILTRTEDQARALRITQSTLISTFWALVLRRYARSDDIVFGATNAGRPADLPGADKAAGAFLNTLPLRFRFDPGATVAATLQASETAARARRGYEVSSLADVQAWSDLPAGTPVFDTVFAFERLPALAETQGAPRLGALETVQSSNYPLTCLATPGEGLTLEVYFDPAQFTATLVAAMLEDFEHLLGAALDNPQTTVSALSQALPDLTVPDTIPAPATVLTAIVDATTANAPAVSDSTQTLSYGDLTDRVTRVAGMLVGAGVCPGDVIPVALPRGVDGVVAMLALLRAGAAYVPLDVTYPRARIEQVLDTVQPPLVVTASDVPVFGTATRFLIDDDPLPTGVLPAMPGGDDLAYVIFTSGSQGRPKGVPITHAAVAQSTFARSEVYGRDPGSFLLLSSLAFDSSVVGLYWTLTTGGHLVIGDSGIEQDPAALAAVIARHQVCTTLCLPRLYQALLGAAATDLHSLETVIVAGEAVPADLPQTHRAQGGQARLFNEYGPTEATVWCSALDLTDHAGEVPIGQAIPGVTLAICDRDRRPLPAGVVGEIVVAGPTVASGYLGQGDEGSPFRTDANGLRSYATGDLGVCQADGNILFLGREDQQVKIRGHRVDLSEVELCARAVTGAGDVAAVVVDAATRPVIVLCLARAEDADLAQRLSAAFDADLPGHARPARLHWTQSFPLLPNGKVDLVALAADAQTTPPAPMLAAAPEGDTEQRLAAIWCAVLGCDSVGRDADFFDLGGDSLLSIGLFVKAEQEGLPIQPTDIFEHPTLRNLAAALVQRSAQDDTSGPAATPLTVQNIDGSKPPVFLLHGNMWIYRQLARGLGPDWPVGLQFSHHFHGSQVRLGAGITGFADEALVALRSVRRTGPYILCGYSAGAMITLELARTLRAQGEEVPLVCLIDPPYDGHSDGEGGMAGLPMQGLALTRGLAGRAMQHLGRNSERHRRNVVSQAYALAMHRYRLAPYDGAVHVLQTDGNPAMSPGGTLAMALPGVEVETLPFGHYALLSDSEARLSLTSRMVRRIKRL